MYNNVQLRYILFQTYWYPPVAIDSGRVTYSSVKEGGIFSEGGGGRSWDLRIYSSGRRGIDSEREGRFRVRRELHIDGGSR